MGMIQYKNILIVDDDPVSRSAMSNALLASGRYYAVQFASNGSTAIQILDSQRIHLVITELVLPETDGLAVLDYARQTCPPVPAVVVTGHLEAFEDVARSLGALAFFSKPVSCDEVLETIKHIFRFKSITQNIGLSLSNILQATSCENNNTMLMVATENEKGKFYFMQGLLVHAICGDLTGEDAVNYMLRWKLCTCRHYPIAALDEPPRKTVFKDLTTLLINFAVNTDESSRSASA
jgi:CheY-like chemotaxis protein